MPATLRPAGRADAAVCGPICYDAFAAIAAQHNFPPDFPSREFATMVLEMMLAQPTTTAVVAEEGGRVLGSCFMHDTGVIAAIGPITVDPTAQNGAVGRQMMVHMLDLAAKRGFAGVRLVQAAYHSRSLSLYAKLGFEVREPLACLAGEPPRVAVPGVGVRPAQVADLEACNVLHFRIVGHTRPHELADAQRHGSALVAERDGRITGYSTMLGFPGHAVGEANLDLQALIAGAPAIIGAGFLLPTRNGELFRWCLAHGLRVTQPLTLMSLGLYNEPAGAFLPSILC